jgi:hypothetical protein
LWITVDGQLEDIQLNAGQSRVFDGRIKVLISSMGGNAVVSVTPLSEGKSSPARWSRWWKWLTAAPRPTVVLPAVA